MNQIRANAHFAPSKPAIMMPDRFITYEMLMNGIYSVQIMLAELDLKRDAPIALVVDNPGRHIIILLALMRDGFTVASVRADQLLLASSCGIHTVLTDEKIPVQSGMRPVFLDEKWFTLRGRTPPAACVSPDRIARIIFTSGTTGKPKPIGVTHRALESRVYEVYLSGIAGEARYLTTYGFSGSVFSYAMRVLCAGNTIIFSPFETALEIAQSVGATAIRASASQARGLLEMQARRESPLRLAQFTTGGGPMSVEMMDEIALAFRAEVINTYNSTEASFMGLAAGQLLEWRRRKGNCFVPFATIEIVDENNNRLPMGREGRIRVQSRSMAWEFTGCVIETDAVRERAPWFYPGDIGVIDSDGLLIVTGRVDEVINCGGVKFTPEIIEENLCQHPKLSAVAVVRMTNHEPWLAVQEDQPVTLDEINSWISANLFGELRCVHIAKMFVVQTIPRTGSGKVARGELRRLMMSME